MKKIFIAIAAVAAFTFTSCGGNSSDNCCADCDSTEICEPDTTPQITDDLEAAIESGDEAAVQTALEGIKAKIIEFATDSAELAKYKYQLQKFAADHKDDLNKLATGEITVSDLVSNIENVSELAKEAKDAATADAKTVNNEAKAAAETAKENIKAEAKAKANEAADAAVQKANEETSKAINNAADALKKKLGN